MADDNQLVFEFIADDSNIKKAYSDVEKQAKKTGEGIEKQFKTKDLFGTDKVVDLNEALSEAGGQIQELTGRFGKLGLAAGALALEGLAIKEAFDLTLEGEQLKAINAQFNNLAAQAGLSGEALKNSLEEASAGLVDVSDLLQKANSAIINLGDSAGKLPEVLELSRKVTAALGGDIAQRFEGIVQAVETGNVRLLKQNGIVLDTDKVFEKYAKTIGLTSGELTLANRQQALLNAVLEEGKKRFGDVNTSIQPLTDNFTRIKVALNDLREEFAKSVNERFGGFFDQLSRGALAVIDDLKEAVRAPTPGEKILETATRANAELEKQRAILKSYQDDLKDAGVITEFVFGNNLRDNISKTEEKIRDLEATLAKSREELIANGKAAAQAVGAPETPGAAGGDGKTGASALTPDQLNAIKQRNLQVANLQLQATQEAIRVKEFENAQITNLEQARAAEEALQNERVIVLNAQKNNALAQAEIQYSAKAGFTAQQRADAISAIEDDFNAKSEAQADQHKQKMLQLATVQVATIRNILATGLSGAFQEVGRRLQAGEGLFDDFGASLVAIFGDILINIGQALLIQGLAIESFIAAINSLLPGSGLAAAAAGAGLIIFGSALKASVGKGGGSTAGAGAGGGATAGPTVGEPTFTPPQDVTPQNPGTTVAVNVNGNIMGTSDRSLGLALAEILSEQFSSQGLTIKA